MNAIRTLISNLASLFLALILGVVVWATAIRSSDPIETRNFEIDIQTVGLAANSELTNRLPDSAQIVVQGPATALDEITPGDYYGLIDLSGITSGETTRPILIQGEREQVDVQLILPETVDISVEQILTREIPVTLQVRGEAARGHRIGDVRVEPETILVTGPAPRVENLSEGRVVVFVDNSREDIQELRRPTFYDNAGNVAGTAGLSFAPQEIEILIPVIELAGFAEKPITVDWIGEPAAGYRLLDLKVEPSSVQVTGPPAALESLRVQTEQVDITGLIRSETRRVTLNLPEGISPLEVQPFLVTVEVEPILSSGLVRRPVEIRALGQELTATLEPAEVRVLLFGPIPVLDTLSEDDVRVTVDLLNLEAGNYVLEPFVSLSTEELTIRSTQPAAITIIISDVITSTEEITSTDALLAPAFVVTAAADSGNTGEGNAFAGVLPERIGLLPIFQRRLGLW